MDFSPNERWTFGTRAEVGTVSSPLAGDARRRAMAFSTGYKHERTRYNGNIEYRRDTNAGIARTTWLTRNQLGYQVSPDWRFLGKANLSTSESARGAGFAADFTEIVAGYAYRPVNNDRWNTLIKYTYFYNLPSPGQVSSSGVSADYQQRNHVLSFDTTWDAFPWLSVGFKYGARFGQLRDNRNGTGPWQSARADLFIVRADFHWVREWDFVAEARTLRGISAQDARNGVLLGAYRHFGDNFKVGVGYNFTNYSDNLTNLGYKNRGWFLNALSKF
jgi:hypothetical protein